jgi:hypothetical protein
LNWPAIQEGAIAAPQVFNKALISLPDQTSVPPGDPAGRKHDVSTGVAPQHNFLL